MITIEYLSLFYNNPLCNNLLMISSIILLHQLIIYYWIFMQYNYHTQENCTDPLIELLFLFHLTKLFIMLFQRYIRIDILSEDLSRETTIKTYLKFILFFYISEFIIFIILNIYINNNNCNNTKIQYYCFINVILYYFWDIGICSLIVLKINQNIQHHNENINEILQEFNIITYNTINETDLLNTDCPICLIEFENDDMIHKLPCNHIYHPDCINEWIHINSICPVCRFNLNDIEN